MTAVERDPNKSISKSYRASPQSSTAQRTSEMSGSAWAFDSFFLSKQVQYKKCHGAVTQSFAYWSQQNYCLSC